MKKKVTVKVSKFIIVIVAFLFVAVIAKLSYVVLSEKVDGINLQDKAASIATTKRTLFASRGNVRDINGELLAETVNSYTLIAYLSETRTTNPNKPKHVVDKEMTAKKLAEVLKKDESKLLSSLKKDKYQVELARGITEVLKADIEKLELPGIGFISNSKKRYYSKHTFASYIIGYAKTKEDGTINGELGVEGYYNDILSGTDGYTKYLKYTSSNYQIPNTPEETVEAENGSDIYLTIDYNIQLTAERAVKSIKDKYNSEWAIFTVMDANTGAIVASATSPNFDPNDTNTIVKSGYLNPLISTQYEPGSVMKVFSWASAIEEGKYNPEETYKSGSYELKDGTVIRDANREGWGTINFDTGFVYSSNTAATRLALRLGVDGLSKYYNKLGFGTKTGIELANEVEGDIEFVRESELATASFGQGIGVTAIQMLQGLSSITNDGFTIKPYIVDKIVDSKGNITYQGGRQIVEKVYSSSTVKKMQELMYKMVNENRSKYWIADNVSVMGKTGTAQIANPKGGGYLDGPYDYVRSFAGIFPSDNPKYIVYAVVKKAETTQKGWSGIVTNAIQEIASYAKITENKSDVDPSKLITVDNYISSEVETVKKNLENQKINAVVLGNGKFITNQYPLKKQTILSGGKLYLMTNATEFKMADLTGWSVNEVKTYCELLGLKLEYSGYGYAKTQSITKDQVIDPNNMTLNVEFAKENIT